MKEIQGFGDSAVATLQTSAVDQETVGIEGHYHEIGRAHV